MDLALIEVETPKKLGVAVLATAEAKPGDAVYYIGNIGGEKSRAALYDILKGK